jgi:phenylacetate-CoA ligase
MFEAIGAKKALCIFHHAAKEVPAYGLFLQKNRIDPKKIKTTHDFNALPITEKANYIKKYSLNQRCVHGVLPQQGNVDESGGTSGNPSNWIRSVYENNLLLQVAKFEFEYEYNISQKQIIVLSAWSNGPWATGIKFCQIMQHYALVKSTGTSIENIEKTLKLFGKEPEYIIAGYPPFLKKFLDETVLNLKQYKIHILTGGEGISLEWKNYFKRKLWQKALIISSYGASDIDIGIGFETPFAQVIREHCQKNKELRTALFGDVPTIPMLFQYNPMMHYITQTYNKEEQKSEYVITLCDTTVASPKVRYNLHDEGGVYTYKEMMAIIEKHEKLLVSTYLQQWKQWPILHLPFLYVAGRSDGTISLDGANVYPEQIEAGILTIKALEEKTNSFMIYKSTKKKQDLKFAIAIQLKEGIKANKILQKQYHNAILSKILELNPDFKESYTYNQKLCDPEIILHSYNSPLFAGEHVKEKYIKRGA